MSNFEGPYIVEIKYTVDGKQHVQRNNCHIPIAPVAGTDPALIDVATRVGGSVDLATAVSNWIDLVKTIFNTGTTFDSFDLYYKQDADTPRMWRATGIIGVNGTNVGAHNPAHQMTLTYRTQEGGIMRQVFLESFHLAKTRFSYANTSGDTQAIMDFVVSPASWINARDTSYPIVPLNSIGGENEATFRSRYR